LSIIIIIIIIKAKLKAKEMLERLEVVLRGCVDESALKGNYYY